MAQGGILALKGASISDYVSFTKNSVTVNMEAIGTNKSDNDTAFSNIMTRVGIVKSDFTYTSAYDSGTGTYSVTFLNLNTQNKLVKLLRLFRHLALPSVTVADDHATFIKKVADSMATHTDLMAMLVASPVTVSTTNVTIKFDLTTAFAGYTQTELDDVFHNWIYSRLGITVVGTSLYTSVFNSGVSFDITLSLNTLSDAIIAFKIFEEINNPTSGTDGAGVYGPYDFYAMAYTVAGDLLVA